MWKVMFETNHLYFRHKQSFRWIENMSWSVLETPRRNIYYNVEFAFFRDCRKHKLSFFINKRPYISKNVSYLVIFLYNFVRGLCPRTVRVRRYILYVKSIFILLLFHFLYHRHCPSLRYLLRSNLFYIDMILIIQKIDS